MVLKRKRSESEISCTSSLWSSPPGPTNSMMLDGFQSHQNSIPTPSLFSSRTRKRHRDNRPGEEDVHQHTLSLLYTAQRNPAPSPLSIVMHAPVMPLPPSTQQTARQSSLHAFWAMPPSVRPVTPSSISSIFASTSPLTSSANKAFFEPSNCEDCDASLNSTDGDMMDVDIVMNTGLGGNSGYACTACGKQVCHSCAISNLGADRRCLICAGQKRQERVGGLGWMNMN